LESIKKTALKWAELYEANNAYKVIKTSIDQQKSSKRKKVITY
jgi:hypothetical protein